MATFNKFDQFVADCANGVHNLGANTLKIMLTNSAPLATNTVKANLTEISPGNGYTAGGATVTINSSAQVGGVYTLVGVEVTITAAGGSIGPFRYAVLYNDTPTSPADPLIGWWDYGSSVTLGVGEKIDVVFPSSDILSVT
jgi:hypothetical protein